MRYSIFAVLGAAACSACSPAPEPPLSNQQIVTTRQVGMMMSNYPMNDIHRSIEAGEAPSAKKTAAKSLARWAKVLPTLFPAGTGAEEFPGVSNARPAVWRDDAAFAAAAQDYIAATERLQALAEADDRPGFAAQWARVSESCNSCHGVFREN